MQVIRDLFRPNGSVTRSTYFLVAALQFVTVLIVWTLFNPALIPTPVEILMAMGSLWTKGVFTEELLKSFIVNLKAIFFSTVISLSLAYLTVVPAMRGVVGAASKFRFLGLTGLTLPFTLMFPDGDSLRVAILTFAMSANFVTSMADVVAAIPREEFDHARTLRMGPWRTVWEVVILGRFSQAFEVLRQNAAIGWMMLTMVEVIAQSGGGIGLVLYKANRQFELLPQVFAILLVILFVGYVQDRAITFLKRTVCPYAFLKLERH